MNAYRLKESYRETLRVPLGLALYYPPSKSVHLLLELVELVKPPLVVSVGDFVTENLLNAGLRPNVAVVDYRTMRSDIDPSRSKKLLNSYKIVECVNPPGFLTFSAIQAVEEAVKNAQAGDLVLVSVQGEEDLLSLPAIALAPPRSIVVYGLWLGACVAVICHPSVSRSVKRLINTAFDNSKP